MITFIKYNWLQHTLKPHICLVSRAHTIGAAGCGQRAQLAAFPYLCPAQNWHSSTPWLGNAS